MRSSAATPEEYLAELDPERAEAMRAVREVVNRHLPPGYQEVMNWGMISWEVPLSVYPDTYNNQPLMFTALASQKNYLSLYLLPVYMNEENMRLLHSGGKKLKMGKSCLNFKRADDLPLEQIGEIIARCRMDDFVKYAKAVRRK